jgi:hypothetical protein
MRGTLLIVVLAIMAVAPVARAGERVTLSNGFEIDCHHHVQVENQIRLYFSAGENNYIERHPEDIASIETVPDPPAPPELKQTALAASPKPNPDGKLSQADLGEMLARAGRERNLNVDLLASLVKAESGGDPRAVSRAGARGLMQLMPGTANELGVADSFKPDQNVRGGTVYLDVLLTRYHDNMAQALAAYNAGPAAVDKYRGIPPYSETQAYVARVIHEFNRRVLAREAQAKRVVVSSSDEKETR